MLLKIKHLELIGAKVLPGFVLLLFFSCNKASEKADPVVKDGISRIDHTEDTLQISKEEEKEVKRLVTYHLDSINSKEAVDSFKTKYDDKAKTAIFALNRMDGWRLKEGSQLIVPDSASADFMDFSPFPQEMQILESIPKAVLISRRTQAIGLYKEGKLVQWGPASTGKKSTQTPVGLFYGNYKARKKISTIDKSWIMPFYFNFMNYEGIGTHEYTLPGYPASHGCVRLRNEDAVFVYNWANQWELTQNQQTILQNGTPFMVFGDYDFEAPKPWLDLASDPRSNFLTEKELDTLKSYVAKYQNNAKNFKKSDAPEGEISLPEESLEGVK